MRISGRRRHLRVAGAALTLTLAVFAAACRAGAPSNGPSGPPEMRGLAPRQVANGGPTLLILRGSGFDRGVRVAVGGHVVGAGAGERVTWVNDQVVTAVLAPGLQPGDYTVGVTNRDGQFAKLDFALKVVPADAAEATPGPTPTAPPTPSVTPTPSLTPSPSPSPSATPAPVTTPAPAPASTPAPAPAAPPPAPAPPVPPPAPPATVAPPAPARTATPAATPPAPSPAGGAPPTAAPSPTPPLAPARTVTAAPVTPAPPLVLPTATPAGAPLRTATPRP
ncbi:MAG: hypothetical protein U0531_13360 [Dehalococcoidia bacterium]